MKPPHADHSSLREGVFADPSQRHKAYLHELPLSRKGHYRHNVNQRRVMLYGSGEFHPDEESAPCPPVHPIAPALLLAQHHLTRLRLRQEVLSKQYNDVVQRLGSFLDGVDAEAHAVQ